MSSTPKKPDKTDSTDKTETQITAQESDEGNGLVPLYWFIGAVALIVLLAWLGSEG